MENEHLEASVVGKEHWTKKAISICSCGINILINPARKKAPFFSSMVHRWHHNQPLIFMLRDAPLVRQ